MARNSSSGTRVSALVGKAVKAQLAASPPCDSSSARDVGSSSVKSVSSARLCRALDAVRCQPGLSPGPGRVVRSAAAASSSSSFAQVGAGKPSERRKRAACSAARVLGGGFHWPSRPAAGGEGWPERAAGVAAALGRCPPRSSSSRQRGVAERRTPVHRHRSGQLELAVARPKGLRPQRTRTRSSAEVNASNPGGGAARTRERARSTLHFARSSQRSRSYKDMGGRWDQIKVRHFHKIGYSGVVKGAILANQRHHALKKKYHD